MGLDFVEIVMTIETELGADMNASGDRTFETVGEIHEFLVSTLGAADPDERQHLWTRLVDIIERQQGLRRELITPDARLREDLEIS